MKCAGFRAWCFFAKFECDEYSMNGMDYHSAIIWFIKWLQNNQIPNTNTNRMVSVFDSLNLFWYNLLYISSRFLRSAIQVTNVALDTVIRKMSIEVPSILQLGVLTSSDGPLCWILTFSIIIYGIYVWYIWKIIDAIYEDDDIDSENYSK